MLSGRYAYRGEEGTVTVDMKETETAFTIRLVHNTGRWIDPPLDDVLRDTGKCVVKKGGSKHGMTFWDGGFCLYPFRVGVPFPFEAVDEEGGKTMTLEQFFAMFNGGTGARFRTSKDDEYLEMYPFEQKHRPGGPLWNRRIDTIKTEFIRGECCFTIALRREESS